MSQLVLYEWKEAPVINETNPYYSCIARHGEKVFVYNKDTSATIDKTNKSIVLKRFGKAKITKVNEMAVNHMDAVNLKKVQGQDSYNKQRLNAIKDVDEQFADFFLKRLHDLVWLDYDKGILSTISFEDAFEMLKKATHAVYDLLIASVDDKYSKDLSISEMKNVIDLHNLNNEYTLGKDLPQAPSVKKNKNK
jgi:hypothetical protein